MPRRKEFSPEQIVTMLRKIEVETSTGQSIAAGCRKAGITEQTFYRWRREFGGLNIDQAKRLKTLELENNRLKKVVADQALDISILKEAARGNF
jgi:putative transposase